MPPKRKASAKGEKAETKAAKADGAAGPSEPAAEAAAPAVSPARAKFLAVYERLSKELVEAVREEGHPAEAVSHFPG